MTLKIFVSWSGERSRMIAGILSDWMPRVIQSVQPWMSDVSIAKGEAWSKEIGSALASQEVGVFCITPENYSAPWLIFEAGALASYANVCPLLFGMTPDELDGPLTQFQATVFKKDDFYQLLQVINDLQKENKLRDPVLKDVFERFWPELEESVKKIMAIGLKQKQVEIKQIVKVFSKFGFSVPDVGNYASFDNGYESHQLYSAVTSIAEKRLYIYGRKNRKLFDKEYFDFFRALPEKLANGFDLKILFLDPDAPQDILGRSHHDADIKAQIAKNIEHASTVLRSFNIDPSVVCRKYILERPHGLIVVDDAILHAVFEYDDSGILKPTTKSAFNILSAQSAIGGWLVSDFVSVWERAKGL